MKNNEIFDNLEKIDGFKADLDFIRFAIESSEPVIGNDQIAAEKARLTMINRANRIKRLKKFESLPEPALLIVAKNVDSDKLEKTAIYAQDKIAQLARFMSGESSVFGRGRNNTALYTLRGIAAHGLKSVKTADNALTLQRFGQPAESSQTQSSSSLKALEAFGFLTGRGRGVYDVNYNNELLNQLLDSIK
jgi:hypothetical protein